MCATCGPRPERAATTPPGEPTGQSGGGAVSPGLAALLPSDIEQLQIRIEAVDTHLMRIQHLYDIGSSIVANTPGNWPGLSALQWVFDLQRERIAWARETLITDDERESDAYTRARRRLFAPSSVKED